MANRSPSDGSGSKGDGVVESKGRIRQWVEGMRVEALANLAHELRTPLQVLHGYLDILRDEWAERLDAEPRSMLDRMNSNMHDLSHTVDNIMEFVMFEAGVTGRVQEDVLISNLVSDLAPAIEAARVGKDVTLKIDLEDAPPTVHIARRPLRSILSNLILNAIKFTDQGSVTVRISAAPAHNAEPGLVLEVSDTGMGMSPALIKQAAEPFTQLSRTSARKYRGLGLGLAVVHRNVQALGAKLEITSTPGRGSRFVVRIPPTPFMTEEPTKKMDKRIFGRGSRAGKHTPRPPAIQPPPASPRKAAGATDGGAIVLL